uniref:potassium/sodium hyperpolarization-activated cyclic nucleotide-gated channel 1-like isoform X2 n=1 Tax=Pristiophorus japonicus TaxID=55135 RepID=UPI00398F70B5
MVRSQRDSQRSRCCSGWPLSGNGRVIGLVTRCRACEDRVQVGQVERGLFPPSGAKIAEFETAEPQRLQVVSLFLPNSATMENSSQNVAKTNKIEPTQTLFLTTDRLMGYSLGKAQKADEEFTVRPGLRTGSAAFHGSVAKMRKDYLKATDSEDFAIHPHSTFRHDWLIMMMILMSVNVIVIPLGISFFTEPIYTGGIWISYIVLSDLIAIVDLALNFYIGYIDEKLEYAGGVDVSRVGYAASRVVRLIKLTRIMSLLRLLRFSSLMRYVRYWKEIHEWDVGMTRVLHLMYWIAVAVLFCHWNACLQFLIVLIQEFPENSWVRIQGLENAPIRVQYTYAIFRALCHMMCLDYGALQLPEGVTEIWILNLSMLTGSIMYALLLAQVTAMVANSDSSRRVYREKVHEYKEFLRHHQLPMALRLKVLNQLAQQFRGKWFDETVIFGELSESLKQEVIHHNCSSLVANAPFFKDCDENFMIAMLSKLKFQVAQSGEVLFQEGAVGNYMLFIERGTMLMEGLNFSKKLTDGAFLGEMSILTDEKREATVTAVTPCKFYTISKADFKETLELYPKMKGHFEKVLLVKQETLPHESISKDTISLE